MVAAVTFQNISRYFGSVRAVHNVSFEIAAGEFFAMLGPSGSGKTTCLRLIAGFDQPTNGQLAIFGEAAAGVPPYRRNVNTVFQDYALFPHLNVLGNVAYGLRMKGVPRAPRESQAREALAMVRLSGMEARKPAELSGGQRQRVALARALVNRPKVLLLDEPLGALDLKLREEMQLELKALQKALGITFVFVTHDQSEALSMADRVAVFNEGTIAQIGTPQEVYERPRTRFVAGFVGSSNLLDPEFSSAHGGVRAWTSLRPEKIRIVPFETRPSPGYRAVRGTVKSVLYQGSSTRIAVDVNGTSLAVAASPEGIPAQLGETVALTWPANALHALEAG